jgi:hypothetical protein
MGAREVTVEAPSRWDAVELLRRLQAVRSTRTYMIQEGVDRWTVHVQPTVHNGDGSVVPSIVDDLLASVQRWVADRGLGCCEVRLDGEPRQVLPL